MQDILQQMMGGGAMPGMGGGGGGGLEVMFAQMAVVLVSHSP